MYLMFEPLKNGLEYLQSSHFLTYVLNKNVTLYTILHFQILFV
jgi:hypothetical protein